MLIAEKKYKLVYPKSYHDEDMEEFEFMFCWIGRRGEIYQWLFEDWTETTGTQTIPINESNSSNVRSLISDELTTVNLVSEDLTRNQLEVFKQASVSKECFRLYKDGTQIKCAVISNAVQHKQGQRFSYSINIELPRKALQR